MKIKILFALCCAALFFSSCTRVFYPATYHQDVAYMPAPASFDSAKTATYVSAGLGIGSNAVAYDSQQSAQLNISRGYSFKNFSLAYGAFGMAGSYGNENDNNDDGRPYHFTHKFYGAFGGRIAGSYVLTTAKADIRVIGLEAAYSHEFGSYAAFRKNLNAIPYQSQEGYEYYVDPRVNLFTLGLTSEVIFHRRTNSRFQQGVNIFLGETFGHNVLDGSYYNGDDDDVSARLFRNLYFKAGYFVRYKNLFAIGEFGLTQLNLRLGFKF